MKINEYLEWFVAKTAAICLKKKRTHFFAMQAYHDEDGHCWHCGYTWHEKHEGTFWAEDISAWHNEPLKALHILKERIEEFLEE
jgi:hypothetical protein